MLGARLEPMPSSPQEDLRDAALKFVRIPDTFVRRIEARLEGDLKSARTHFWGTAYGLGLSCCEGMTMTERAVQIGVE
jgi:hypothetical protein